jgi:hypothetical protein
MDMSFRAKPLPLGQKTSVESDATNKLNDIDDICEASQLMMHGYART